MAAPSVCVVDDDEAVRDSLRALLATAHMEVETYSSARDFLAEFEAERVGCVLVDIRMPGMDGLELQAKICAEHPGFPVIFITGHGDVQLAVQAMKAGAFDFIEKPFDGNALLRTINRALESAEPARHNNALPQAEVATRLERLTPRERDVLRHLVAGRPNKVVAYELGISPRTVEIHRARVLEKMETRNVPELVRMVVGAGFDQV